MAEQNVAPQLVSQILITIEGDGMINVQSNMPLPQSLGYLELAKATLLSAARQPAATHSPILVAKGPLSR